MASQDDPASLQSAHNALVRQIHACTRFLANPACFDGRDIVPRRMNNWSNHVVLMERVPDPDQPGKIIEKEFLAYVVGEIGSVMEGLRVGAAGACPANITIDDATPVKQNIVLRPVRSQNEELRNLMHDQQVGIFDVMAIGAGGQDKLECIKESGDTHMRLIVIETPGAPVHQGVVLSNIRLVTENLYTVIPKSLAGKVPVVTPAVRLSRKRKGGPGSDADAEANMPGGSNAPGGSGHAMPVGAATADASAAHLSPDGVEVLLNGRYDPNLLPDHHGPRFRHEHARVLQFDFRDVDNALIGPWHYLNKVREGAIALAVCGYKVWRMPATANFNRPTMTFQAVVRSLKILRPSDLPVTNTPFDCPGAVSTSRVEKGNDSVPLPAEVTSDIASFSLGAEQPVPEPERPDNEDVNMDNDTADEPRDSGTVGPRATGKGKKKAKN